MTVSKQVASSIRTGNCKDNIQAGMIKKFMKTIFPHWISSSGSVIVGSSAVIVHSSMTLHQACTPNSQSNMPQLEIDAQENDDEEPKPAINDTAQKMTGVSTTMSNTIENDNGAAQPSTATKDNDSNAATDDVKDTGTGGDNKMNENMSNTNKTTPKDNIQDLASEKKKRQMRYRLKTCVT